MADNNNHKHTPNANGNYYSNKNNKGGHPYNNYNKYNNKQQKGNNNRQQNNAQSNKTANPSNANIGWLFYRDYYNGIENITTPQDLKKHFHNKNERIVNSIYNSNINKKISDSLSSLSSFELEVCPPGLLIGSGMLHGVPGEGDYQLGLQFDHSTGLPILPGSSIKGVLRSMFPELTKVKKKDDTNKEIVTYEHDISRINYIIEKLIELKELNLSESDINKLTKLITDNSTPHPIENLTQRLFNHEVCEDNVVKFPVFMDAIIVNGGEGGKILGSDYITPHHDAFKDPVPIQFLKVLPGVKFKFFFILPEKITFGENIELTKDIITNLFKSILQDVGVGAKTNVGYGHLKEIK